MKNPMVFSYISLHLQMLCLSTVADGSSWSYQPTAVKKHSHMETRSHIDMQYSYSNPMHWSTTQFHRTCAWVSTPTGPSLTEFGRRASDERVKHLAAWCSVTPMLTQRNTPERATRPHKKKEAGDETRYRGGGGLGRESSGWAAGRGGDGVRSTTHRNHASSTSHPFG